MFKFKCSPILMIGILLCFSLKGYAKTIVADDSTGSDDTRSYHLGNDLDMNSSVHFQYGKPHIVIKSIYPALQSEDHPETTEELNQLVLDLVKEESEAFKTRVADYQQSQSHLPKAKIKNNFYIDYSSTSGNIGKHFIVSLRFSMQGYIAGMAHPYHYHRVINYDISTQHHLMLPNLFQTDSPYLSVLSNYTKRALSKNLPNQDMIEKGTMPTLDHFALWNFSSNGLVFTFEEYQVAPYVNGAQTIVVPYSVLKDLLPPDSPLMPCLKKATRCMRNVVETGGFIDEM